jgi:hypothetical protein
MTSAEWYEVTLFTLASCGAAMLGLIGAWLLVEAVRLLGRRKDVTCKDGEKHRLL